MKCELFFRVTNNHNYLKTRFYHKNVHYNRIIYPILLQLFNRYFTVQNIF